MKIRTIILAFAAMLTFASCVKEESKDFYIYGGIATALQMEDKDYYFKFDSEKTFRASNVDLTNNEALRDSARVLVSFVMEKKDFGGFDYVGAIQYLDTILTKKVEFYDEAIPDSVGNNSSTINDGYIYGKYLNLDFAVPGQYARHKISLVKGPDGSDADPDYINVEFRHKLISGGQANYVGGVICFDISELAAKYPGKKGIAMKVNDYMYSGERVYKYDFPTKGDNETAGQKEFKNLRSGIDVR